METKEKKIFFIYPYKTENKQIIKFGCYDLELSATYGATLINTSYDNQKNITVEVYTVDFKKDNNFNVNIIMQIKETFQSDNLLIKSNKNNFIFDLNFQRDIQDIVVLEKKEQFHYFIICLKDAGEEKLILKEDLCIDIINIINKTNNCTIDLFIDVFRESKEFKCFIDLMTKYDFKTIKMIPIVNTDKYCKVIEEINNNKKILYKYAQNKEYNTILKQFLLIMLYFYKMYNQQEFIKHLNTPKLHKLIKTTIVENLICFTGMNAEMLSSYIKILANFAEIKEAFLLAQNLEEALKCFLSCKEYIQSKITEQGSNDITNYTEMNSDFIITKNVQLKQDDNLDEIFKYYNELKEMKLFDENFFEKYSDVFKGQDYKQLKKINEESKKQNKNTRKIQQNLYETFLSCITKIEKDTFLDEVLYLKNIIKNNKKNENNILLSEKIDLLSLNKEKIKKIQKIDFGSFFEDNEYKNFLNTLYSPIKTFEQFEVFIDIGLSSKKSTEFTFFTEKITELLQQKEKINLESLTSLICYFFQMQRNTPSHIKLLEIVEQNMEEKDILFLYDNILSRVAQSFKTASETMITYINNHSNNVIQTMNRFVDILSGEQLRFYFNSLCPFIIKFEDFFAKNETKKSIKILKEIQSKNYMEKKEISSSDYMVQTKGRLNKIINALNSLELTYREADSLLELSDEELKEMINLCCFNDLEKQKNCFIQLKQGLLTYKAKRNISNKAIIFYTYFYSQSKDKIEKIQKITNTLKEKKLNELSFYEQSFEALFRQKQEFDTYNSLTESQYFGVIYKSQNEKDENLKRKNAKEKFETLENLITNTLDKIPKDILELCYIKVNKEEEIKKEFVFLKQYFKKEDIDTTNVQKLVYFLSKKTAIILIINSIQFFFEQFKIKLEDYNVKLNKIKTQLNESKLISNFEDYLQQLGELNISIETTSDLEILLCLYQKCELVQFLQNKKEEDVRNLIEFVEAADDAFLKPSDIQDLIIVVNFVSELQTKATLPDKQFIAEFQKMVKNTEKYKNIEVYFRNVSQNSVALKDLYTKIINKDEFTQQIIAKLYKSSMITIETNSNTVNCICEYENRTITFEEIIEIRDRALLKKRDTDTGKDEKFERSLKFATIVSQIENIITSISELLMKGYPNDFLLSIKIEDNKALLYEGKEDQKSKEKSIDTNGKTLKEYNERMTALLDELMNKIISGYQSDPILCVMYGKMFRYFFNYLRYGNKIDEKGTNSETIVFNFLDYITNNQCIKKIKNFAIQTNNDIVASMINSTKDYLLATLSENKLSTQEGEKDCKFLYQNSLIKKNISKHKGLYTRLISLKSFESESIFYHKMLTGNLPKPQTTLLCNELTTVEELTAFLTRAILCKSNVLFSIMKIEQLDLFKGQKVLEILNDLYIKEKDNMKSCLLFLYTNTSDQLIIQIKKLVGHQFIEENFDKIDLTKENITVVSSDASGIGKSHWIRDKNNSNKKKYVYFPLGGEITREEVIQCLKDKEINNPNTLLHIDLVDSKKVEVMRDFLFSFLILHYFPYNEHIVYLNENIQIMVEVPFGFVDFLQQYSILKEFQQHKMSKDKLPEITIPGNPLTNIQIVCMYLDLYDKNEIDKYNLFIERLTNAEITKKNKEYYFQGKIIERKRALALLAKYYNTKKYTFYQINSFINAFADQLKYLTNSLYLEVDLLKNNAKHSGRKGLKTIRNYTIKSLLEITQYFTKGAYSDLISQQNIAYQSQTADYNLEQAEEKAINALSNKEVVSFDKIKPSLIFFNEDGQSLTVISTCDKNEEEYKNLQDLINSGSQEKKVPPLVDYKNLEPIGYLNEVKKVLDLKNDVIKDIKLGKKVLKSISSIVGSYVFTSDNFIKMILILIRIRANIPVIMMGETGCGKTSLIRMIADLKQNKMKILNIHAGITDKDIIDFMKKNNFLYNKDEKPSKEKQWVFLDEINTCNSMGLISEMMCHHTMQGAKIKDEVVFIAACNPYRKIGKTLNIQVGLVDKKFKQRKLVYTVNPLPHSLLNFVFDFGNLTRLDREKYIKSMINGPISKYYLNQLSPSCEHKKKIALKLTILAQDFVQTLYGISSVSLREVRRFQIFFDWFVEYLRTKENITDTVIPKNVTESKLDDIIVRSIVLSIYICYYLRLQRTEDRTKFKGEIEKSIPDIKFTDIADKEINYLIDQFDLPKGTAKNKALMNNIFTIFVCINTKIPVFICGKPGCSKSLSVQLLYNAMKGEISDKALFKKLPRLFINSYQGSLTSTSKGVLEVFRKARNIIRKQNNQQNIISLVYFDEMGLAEISKNNPLKVIHSQLEYDENEDKVAFVGISNWTLDASKMNRGVFLSIIEPDEEDIKLTSRTIAETYSSFLLYSNQVYFDNLGLSYYKFKEQQKNYIKKADFFGLRDFYHCIKTFCRLMIKDENNSEEAIINKAKSSIERNFGGQELSVNEVINLFFTQCNSTKEKLDKQQYDVMKCITDNITDYDSRYLLIVSKASTSHFLVTNVLRKNNADYEMYIGSRFENDENEQFYKANMISKIQMCMEQEKVLILQNLSSVYTSLYDLFNQNFTSVGNKKFARIALGSSNNLMSWVNDKFRCAILVDEKELENQDPPFLNRFEKHILSYDSLLSKEQIEIANDIVTILHSMVEPSDKKFNLTIDLREQLINADIEEIKGLVYSLVQNNVEPKQITNEILNLIVPTFSQDLICFIKYSKLKPQYHSLFIEKYNQDEHGSFAKYFSTITHNKSIVYTFSQILQEVKINGEIANSKFGTINKNNIKEIIVNAFKSENDVENTLFNYYDNPNLKVLLLKFGEEEFQHLNFVNYTIDNYEKKRNFTDENKKIIVFVIHLSRKEKEEDNKKEKTQNTSKAQNEFLSHLTSYPQIMIDNLNGESIKISELLDLKNKNLVERKELININTIIDKNIFQSFALINYEFRNQNSTANTYIQDLTNKIRESSYIKNKIKELIKNNLEKEEPIIASIYKKKDAFITNNVEIIEEFVVALRQQIEEKVIVFLHKFIIKAELDGALQCIMRTNNFEEIKEMINPYFEKMDLSKLRINNAVQGNEISIVLGINIPFSLVSFGVISEFVKQIKTDFYTLENELRYYDKGNEKADEFISSSILKENNFVKTVNAEIEKEHYLSQIINYYKTKKIEPNIELVKLLIKDYFKYFLTKKFNGDLSSLEQFLSLFLSLRIPENFTNPFNYLSHIILYCECNAESIYQLCTIYNTFNPFIEDLYNKISNQLMTIKIEETERNLKTALFVNRPYYICVESMFGIILDITNPLFEFKEEKSYNFINAIKANVDIAKQLEMSLFLYTKEIYTVDIFIRAYEQLMKTGEKHKEYLKSYIVMLNEEKAKREENQIDELIKCLTGNYLFLKTYLEKIDGYSELIISIFFSKYLQINDTNYRYKIFEIILSDNKLIQNSAQLFSFIFSNLNFFPEIPEPENKEEYINNFLFITGKNDDKTLLLIENQNNAMLYDIILYIFEIKCYQYFSYYLEEDTTIADKIYKITNDISFDYFKKSIEYLHSFIKDKSKLTFPKLTFLLAVAYVKIYLSFAVQFDVKRVKEEEIQNNNNNNLEIHQVIKGYSDKDTANFFKVIKLYVIKLYRQKMSSYEELKEFKFKDHGVIWINDFSFEEANNNLTFDFSFLDIPRIEGYKEFLKQFEVCSFSNFNDDAGEIANLIQKHGLIMFFDLTINKIVNNLAKRAYLSTNEYKNFSKFAVNLLKSEQMKNFQQTTKKLLELFYTEKTVKEKIKKVHPTISQENFEILLYSLKSALICSLSNPNSFYSNLLSPQMKATINNNYIPGGEPNDDLIINSFNEVENYLNVTNNPSNGAYICSCDSWYSIDPCGLPATVSKCSNCGQDIGGQNHYLIERPGHFRVFKDEAQKKNVTGRFYYKPIPYKMLEDFRKEIDKLVKQEKKGIKQITFGFFTRETKKIRGLDQTSYRLLNFILYSAIHFSYILGYISEQEVSSLCCFQKNSFNMITENWNYLNKILLANGVNNIRIFMNQVLPKVSKIIIDSNQFLDVNSRYTFEEKIVAVVNESIRSYAQFANDYTKENNNLLHIELNSLKSIIHELNDPTKFDQKTFPYMQYFCVASYPSEDTLRRNVDLLPNKVNVYPVLSTFLDKKSDIDALQNLLLLNPFAKAILSHYTYQITRAESKSISICKAIQENEDLKQEEFTDFREGWNNMMNSLDPQLIKFKCRPEMPKKEISEQDSISYCLNDDGELNYGMYLASLYQNLIFYQNQFLKSIKENFSLAGRLRCFKEQIENEMYAQEAGPNEVVTFDFSQTVSLFKSIFDIFIAYTKRQCYNQDGTINYSNYKNIEYNMDMIEETLGKIILPGKRLFKDDQKFVTFGFEGYRGEARSSILLDFSKKYHQKHLTQEEKNQMSSKISSLPNYTKFMFTLQMMIFFFNKENYKVEEKISDIIPKLPDYLNIIDEVKGFFNSNREITLDKLLGIYEYVELLCYPQIKENVNIEFFQPLSPECINAIDNHYQTKRFITKAILADGVRKYLSRSISGKRMDNEVEPQKDLIMFIQYKEEIWDPVIFADERFDEEMMELSIVQVKNQSVVAFCDYLMGVKEEPPKEQQPKRKRKRLIAK